MTTSRRLITRLKTTMLPLALVLGIIALAMFYIRPVRNALLRPVWPYNWRPISSSDILYMMRHSKPPENVTDLLSCTAKTPPAFQLSDISSVTKVFSYPMPTLDNEFFKDESHARFAPGVSPDDRRKMVWMYLIVAEALKSANVSFFLTNGSLLGVYRHGGIIPWDTDLDVTLNVTTWKTVRRILSCIEGFRLETKPFMHWKFYPQDKAFPFIDLFFFTENDDYLWALTHYEFKHIVYSKKDIFPLRTSLFEGVRVPVPAETEHVIRQEFDVEYCYPPSLNYKTGVRHEQSYVLCSSLAGVYPMKNLRF